MQQQALWPNGYRHKAKGFGRASAYPNNLTQTLGLSHRFDGSGSMRVWESDPRTKEDTKMLTTNAQAKRWAKNVIAYLVDDRDEKTVDALKALQVQVEAHVKEHGVNMNVPAGLVVIDDATTIKGLAKILERVPRANDKDTLGMAASIAASVMEDGGGEYGNGQMTPVVLAAYDPSIVPDGLSRSAILAYFNLPVVGLVNNAMTNESAAVDVGVALNFTRRHLSKQDQKDALRQTVLLYTQGKLPKHWTVAFIAKEHSVSEQTVRNQINALKRPATAAAEQVVTSTAALERASRIPLPTPIPGNPDIASRLVADVKAWPATYPIPEAVKLFNNAHALASVEQEIGAFLKRHDVTFDAYGFAVLPRDVEEAAEELAEAAA